MYVIIYVFFVSASSTPVVVALLSSKPHHSLPPTRDLPQVAYGGAHVVDGIYDVEAKTSCPTPGHYIIYAHIEGDQWYCLDDSNATTAEMGDTLTKQAYIISYTSRR